MSCFYVNKVYDQEPDNKVISFTETNSQKWFLGFHYREGKKLYIPGDVPESPLQQKRTAEYKVQSLVMGVETGDRPYNSATLSVSTPKGDKNKERGIPLQQVQTRNMGMMQTEEVIHKNDSNPTLEYVFITNYGTRKSHIYNMNTKAKTPVELSAETTTKYFGVIHKHASDVTVTLQGTY